MKKTKILLASVAVASLAAGCGIFAACNNTPSGETTYNITFDANGGAYGEESSVTLQTGSDGKLTALPENDPTYANHEFDGYNTAANGSGSKVTVNDVYTSTTTVYAQWSNIYTVTFVTGTEGTLATGAAATATTTKGKLATLPEVTVSAEKKSFLGWYTTASGEGDEITVDYVFSGDTLAVNAYARYRDEYTVTLSAGEDGTIATGTTVTYVTKNGKIDGNLPADEVTCTKANFHFGGWLDGETDVDEREYVFERDTTLTAKYVQDNGLWNQAGTEMLASLVLNPGATDHTEYWFGAGTSHEFTQGTVITVYLDGKKQENFWLKGTCVDLSADAETNYGGVTTSEATVTEDAAFTVYIKLYPSGGTTYEFNGTPTKLPETNELPAGADAITITVKAPATEESAEATLGTLTLYIIGKDGKSVQLNPAAEDYDAAVNYQIHAWSGSDTELFGKWENNPTLNTALVLNYANFNKQTTLMFHWNGGQTDGISGMELNGTYVIDLRNKGSVKKYVAPTGGDAGNTGDTNVDAGGAE